MKAYIIREKCLSESNICPPMKNCPNKCFSYIEDEEEPLGGRIEIDFEKCVGCGKCVTDCCGDCIELR